MPNDPTEDLIKTLENFETLDKKFLKKGNNGFNDFSKNNDRKKIMFRILGRKHEWKEYYKNPRSMKRI